jgi:hypothetical protein
VNRPGFYEGYVLAEAYAAINLETGSYALTTLDYKETIPSTGRVLLTYGWVIEQSISGVANYIDVFANGHSLYPQGPEMTSQIVLDGPLDLNLKAYLEASGTIGRSNYIRFGFWITDIERIDDPAPVPEPSSGLLIFSALAASLLLSRALRHRKQVPTQ